MTRSSGENAIGETNVLESQLDSLSKTVLEGRNIARNFGAVVALEDASIAVQKGEVVGLVGDNGAGKSTLLKILSGTLAPSSGEIQIDGQRVSLSSAQDAIEMGIETVYQDLALVDSMTAYQNVYLGREELSSNPILRFFGLVDDKKMRSRAREVLDSLAIKIPSITADVQRMSGGQRQCLAIARALLWGRRIVILDEPTAALGVRETAQVLDVIRDLKSHNVSVLLVSHNMQQVMDIADRVTVIRLGKTIANRDVKSTDVSEIVGLITGAIAGDREKEDAGKALV